jgi:cytochrome c-type biogenesis protein CcmE
MKPAVTIRLGALHNSVTVDGHVFDRNAMSKTDNAKLRNILIDGLVKAGSIRRKPKRERTSAS